MRRWLGAALVILGCSLLAVHPPGWDTVLIGFSPHRGLHVSDIAAAAAVIAGIALLWDPGTTR